MNDDKLNELFNSTDKVVIEPSMKQRAISAALDEFDSHVQPEGNEHRNSNVSFKGILSWLRPTGKSKDSRNIKMKIQRITWFMGATVTASVVLFAGFITLRVPYLSDAPIATESKLDNPYPVKEIAKTEELTLELDDSVEPSESDARETQFVAKPSPIQTAKVVKKREPVLEEEVIVTGIRSIAAESTDIKREASGTVDAISAEDIGSIPNESVALESLQRVASEKSAAQAQALSFSPERKQKLARSIVPMPTPNVDPLVPSPIIDSTRERFEQTEINPVKRVNEEPVSTFSIDVDTSSYSFARRKLNQGVLPDKHAVRVEEFLNYFDYDYPLPRNKSEPFSTSVIVSDSPWREGSKLLHIGIKGYDIVEQPNSNLVFLLDVSGSMSSHDKLPLVKQSMSLLLSQLKEDDTVAIVVYAGAAGTVLEPTLVKEKQKILDSLSRLQAGGSTAGAQGIERAYQLAEQNFKKDAVNRIILATDGDFNVGINNPEKLKTFVERKREKGIFLSVLGFGQGNYYDALMQKLAQNGNGVAAYIDSLSEAQKVLVNEATSSLFPIAKDVKIQVEFNPATVAEYRLIGYETRALKREDFNNDKVDAGDIGAGHSVTAIYEITPVNAPKRIEDSRYENNPQRENTKSGEYALLKLRYKLPSEDKSKLIERIIKSENTDQSSALTQEHEFATAVASFAQLLRGGKYTGELDYDAVIEQALENRGKDVFGYRNEFVQLVRKAKISKAM